MDNLPQEVTFLLEEMRIKEDRLQSEFHPMNRANQQRATKILTPPPYQPHTALLSRLSARTTQLLKSARPQSSSSVSALGPKDQQALEKIDLEWAKVDTVQSEKLALAERLLIIVNRARERGREEFKKVANEEDMSVVDPQEAAVVDKLVSGGGVQQVLAGLNQQAGGVGLVGALQRGMLGSQVVPGPSQAQVLMDEKMKSGFFLFKFSPRYSSQRAETPSHLLVERKAGPYSNMPPPASPVPVTYTTPSAPQPSRKRRNPSASVEPSQVDERGESESGDGEDDPNGDDKLYCVCQQKSYGEMIGCDNDNCRFEWVSFVWFGRRIVIWP